MPFEDQSEHANPSEPMTIDGASGLKIVERRFPWSRGRVVHDGSVSFHPPEIQRREGLLIYVHGYNEDVEMAKAYGKGSIAAGYAESGGKCSVATFLWNSKFGVLRFGRSIQAANATAPVFAQAIDRLREACPGRRVHVLAHSLGARVVLKAIAETQIRLHDVALVAPAVDADALLEGGEFAAVPVKVDRLLITHNAADRSLHWYRTRGRPALGERGFSDADEIPANVAVEDMTKAWSLHSEDGGHGAILHPLFWGEFWRRAAEREFFGKAI